MLSAYKEHITANDGQVGSLFDKSVVGKLRMSEDIFLVVCCWRETHLTEVDPLPNVVLLRRDELEPRYSPSLSSRPHFRYREGRVQRLCEEARLDSRFYEKPRVTLKRLSSFVRRHQIPIPKGKVQKQPLAEAIIEYAKKEKEEERVGEPEQKKLKQVVSDAKDDGEKMD